MSEIDTAEETGMERALPAPQHTTRAGLLRSRFLLEIHRRM